MEIDLITDKKSDDSYSFHFILNGNKYSNHDYQSRESALEDARSIARCVMNGIKLKDGDCYIESN